MANAFFRYREDGKTYSFNALFISFRSQQQSRYTSPKKIQKKQCSPIFPLTDSLTPQDTPADGCAEYRTRADACLW